MSPGDAVVNAAPARPEWFDAVTFSVILNRFNRIAEEMTVTLEQAAWTPILAICRDFSCAIYDVHRRQVCMYDALPIHTTSLHTVLDAITEAFESDIAAGDVFMSNDPYRGNTHIGDLVTACPVFVGEEHLFWSVTRGHQLDTGAPIASSIVPAARNVWQEGITIPPVRVVAGGVPRADVIELYLANVRYRDLLEGDLLAQLGSIEKGRQRLVELCEEYSPPTVVAYVDELIDYASRRMADELRMIPDGTYSATGWIDTDGVDAIDIPVRVAVTVSGDRIVVDFGGSGPQGAGGVNGSEATSRATAAVPFLCYIAEDIPHNHGCIAHIDVHAPKGSICNAEYPASTSCATSLPSDLMHSLVNMAMAQAIPERVPAGGARQSNIPQISGVRSDTGEAWGVMLFNGSAGGGASHGTDGWPLFESMGGMGEVKTQSIEQIELTYPLRFESVEIEPDSMGSGEQIGGPGVRMRVRSLDGELDCVIFGDGARNPPHGILGGTPGAGGGTYVEPDADRPRRFISACGRVLVGPDEAWVSVSSGGGGYGHPAARPVAQVRSDVINGIISREAAGRAFGVALQDDPECTVDEQETARLRAALLADGRAPALPTQPAAATWVEENMRSDDVFLLNPQ
jgi:N-methylhydantoinase B